MPRGVATAIPLKERALALIATGENYSSTARLLELSKHTVKEFANHNIEFAQVRSDIEQHYIIEAWSSVISGHNELLRRLNDKEELTLVSTVELATIIEKVHRTVTAVAANVIAIQATLITDSNEDIETAAFDYVAGLAGITVIEAKKRLGLLQ